MDKYLDQFFGFIDSIKGTKEAGIVEIIGGVILVIIGVIYMKNHKNNKK